MYLFLYFYLTVNYIYILNKEVLYAFIDSLVLLDFSIIFYKCLYEYKYIRDRYVSAL